MQTITLNFTKCVQNSQILGTDREHMTSDVYFTIDDGTDEFICCINQPDGSDHSFEDDPLVVITPDNLKHEVNVAEFREAVEAYYRLNFGGQGVAINTFGSNGITMRNVASFKKAKAEISKQSISGAW